MKKSVVAILVLVVMLAGCSEEPAPEPMMNETNVTEPTPQAYLDFLQHLNAGQLDSYSAQYYEEYRVSSGQRKETLEYNLTVTREFIDEGPASGLTATRIRQIVKDQVEDWTKQAQHDLVQFELSKKVDCFAAQSEDGSFTMCFDLDNSLVYYKLFGDVELLTWRLSPQLVWKIAEQFPFTEDQVDNQFTIQNQRAAKSADCTTDECTGFFTVISQASDQAGKDDYLIEGFQSSALLTSLSESNVKEHLSESITAQCGFKYTLQGELGCYELKPTGSECSAIDVGFIEFVDEGFIEYPMQKCNYCFSTEGFLVSGTCLASDGQEWQWSKAR